MLASAHRLRRSIDFAETVRGGRRAGGGTVVVHLLSTPETMGKDVTPARTAGEDPAVRAGFVVGRQVGPAVTRNRVKRRLRHLMRERIDSLPAGSRVVIRALAPAAQADFDELARDLDTALAAARRGRAARRSRGSDVR